MSAEPTPFNADALVRLERLSDPRWSPDGSRIAYTVRTADFDANKGVQAIWLHELATSTRRPYASGAGSAWSPRWAADGSLYFLSTRSGTTQVWRLDRAGGDARAVTNLPIEVAAFVLAPDGSRIVVAADTFPEFGADLAATRSRLDELAARKRSGQHYDRLFIRHWDTWKDGTRAQLFSFALDDDGLASGAPAWLSAGIDGDVPSKPFGGDEEITFTPDAQAVIFTARIAGVTEPWSTNFYLFAVPAAGAAEPRNLTPENPAWDTGPVVSPDGEWLAYRAMRRPGFEADRFAIMVRPLAGGPAREVAPDWDRSADGLAWSADGNRLYTMADDLGQKRLFAVDVASGEVTAMSGEGTVEDFDRGPHGVFVIAHNTLAAQTALYTLPAQGGATTLLARHEQARLAQLAIGDYEQFQFAGWNDETVHGYVVKPVGCEPGKKYPVAFIIHGGPQGSMGNHWHYRWNPQVYAGAGFAVVFIDFHGSTGYGQAFTDAISGHWGDRPLEDLQKGWAAALAKYPFLDAGRACALGASYGGYMVNWIAANWQAPWKCLVNHCGVFDNRAMAYSTEELWFDEWENQGTQYERPENYEQFNPVNHIAKWSVPMLVIQGGKDFRIPTEQGIATFTALQRRGVPSEFLYFPDENHWVLKPQNSVQWHEAVLTWLRRWTPPAARP